VTKQGKRSGWAILRQEADDFESGLLPVPDAMREVLSGLESALRVLKFNVGDEFEVLTVSFNPQETPATAAAKKGGISEALRANWCGAGLAFPDRVAGIDRRTDQGSRFSV